MVRALYERWNVGDRSDPAVAELASDRRITRACIYPDIDEALKAVGLAG